MYFIVGSVFYYFIEKCDKKCYMFHFVAGNKMLYFLIQAGFLRPPVLVFGSEDQE